MPLRLIMGSLHVGVARGALVVVAFPLALAVAMPLSGWWADRLGRRRVLFVGVVAESVLSLGAALAPDLVVLVVVRALQGLAAAAILPCVMGLVTEVVPPERRGRALGLWAGANGLGQAVGPPLGGLLASAFDWRAIFAPALVVGALAAVGTLRLVPARPGRRAPLEWRGALLLVVGTTLAIGSAMLVPDVAVALWPLLGVAAAAGVACLWLALAAHRRVPAPFVDPQLWREPSFLRSALAVFAQMFCLGATLLAVPLALTRAGLSAGRAGLVVFALPATMTVLAPLAGVLTERVGPRRVLRIGLSVLVAAELALGGLAGTPARVLLLVPCLVAAGVGIALVQTPAAAGATRSRVGRAGTGLGLFNAIRFAGSALGAAWVAVALAAGHHAGVGYLAAALLAGAGLLGTFAGPDPRPEAAAP